MNRRYTKQGIRQRFTMSDKDVEGCEKVFVAVTTWNERNREAADVWCALNPWSREAGGTSVMVQKAARCYLDAANCERKKITARVVRITEKDAGELLAYRDRFLREKMEEAQANVR